MLMCILPLAAILFYNLYSLRQSQERAAHEAAYRLGEVASLEMARIIGGIQDTLIAISNAPIIRNFDVETCNAYMVRITKALPQFSGIAVLDSEGIIRCLQSPQGIGVSLADKQYFKESFANGKTVLGTFTKGRVSGSYVLPVAVPIKDDTGKVTGVVAGSVSQNWLEKRLTERQFAKGSSLTVADSEGTIVARFPEPTRFVGTRIPEQFRKLVNAVAPGTLELTSQDGTRRVLAYFPPSSPTASLYVSVGLSTDEEYGATSRAMLWGLAVTVGAILAAAALAWLTGRYSIRRPVDRLVSTVEAWRHDQPGARTGLTEADGEFGIVGKAIDAYMDELVEVRSRSDILMRELDHRVKNLLATVQVITRQSLKSANVDPAILKKLNARLAAMSDAHSLLLSNDKHTAGFAEIVGAAIHPFDNPGATPFHVSGPDFTLGSTAALAFSMALHELATNAAKYGSLSVDGGSVAIEWDVQHSADGEVLAFEWRESGGPPAAAPSESGFGSVMIQRMLADQLRGELSLDYSENGVQIRFTVSLINLNQ